MSVVKADREAAASGYFVWIGSNPVVPAKMRAGTVDDHSMVQAFARHRTDAQRELLEALEDALAFIRGDISGFHQRSGILQAGNSAIDKARGA